MGLRRMERRVQIELEILAMVAEDIHAITALEQHLKDLKILHLKSTLK